MKNIITARRVLVVALSFLIAPLRIFELVCKSAVIGEKLSKQVVSYEKALYKLSESFYYAVHRGEMAEWINAPVLKTGEG